MIHDGDRGDGVHRDSGVNDVNDCGQLNGQSVNRQNSPSLKK
ncbi:hypothetical protein A2U01_0073463, partial [Trifolium medium]|nr:hypothetical protein [Trifolium medium]